MCEICALTLKIFTTLKIRTKRFGKTDAPAELHFLFFALFFQLAKDDLQSLDPHFACQLPAFESHIQCVCLWLLRKHCSHAYIRSRQLYFWPQCVVLSRRNESFQFLDPSARGNAANCCDPKSFVQTTDAD
jgi:hypothetical protein